MAKLYQKVHKNELLKGHKCKLEFTNNCSYN